MLETTSRIQLWTDEGSMMGVITLAEARQMVNEGNALVVTCQAVRQMPR
jgi:hypothetical protein